MKSLNIGLFSFILIAPVGCGTKSEPGGGSEKHDKFTLASPGTTSIKQGETKTILLTMDREKDFKQAVRLIAEAPAGVDARLSDSVVKPSEKGEVSLNIAVTQKTIVGEHTIRITGTPDTGNAISLDVKIKVQERAEAKQPEITKLSLSGPLLAISITQGDTKTVPITLRGRSADYKGNVKLSVDAPKGISVELTSANLKAADSGELSLKITADKKAALGEHMIQVSGAPDDGSLSPLEVKIKVTEWNGQSALRSFHAYDLFELWEENAAKVKADYDSKQIEVLGQVWRVREDEKLGFFVTFSVDYLSGQVALQKEIRGLRCFFPDPKTAARFEKGQEITVTGRLVMNSGIGLDLLDCKVKKK